MLHLRRIGWITLLVLLAQGALHAEESPRRTFLVGVHPDRVPETRKAALALGASVDGRAPAPADAAAVVLAVETARRGVKDEALAVRLVEASARKLTVLASAPTPGALETLHRALRQSPTLAPRIAYAGGKPKIRKVGTGFEGVSELTLGAAAAGRKPLDPFEGSMTATVTAAAKAAGFGLHRSEEVRSQAIARGAMREHTQRFHLETRDWDKLLLFVRSMAKRAPALTLTDVQWFGPGLPLHRDARTRVTSAWRRAPVKGAAWGKDARRHLRIACRATSTKALLAALHGLGHDVVDLDTGELYRSVDMNAPYARPLPDARDAWDAVNRALAKHAGVGVLAMTVEHRRIGLRLAGPSQEAIRRAGDAIAARAYFRKRDVQLRWTSQGQAPIGPVAGLQLRVDPAKPARPPDPPFVGALTQIVQRAADRSGVKLQWAGAQRNDPNASAGYRTHSRQFRFGTTKRDRLEAFFAELRRRAPKLTIHGLRYELAKAELPGPTAKIESPTIRIGWREKLSR